jgi:hypothetical protein
MEEAAAHCGAVTLAERAGQLGGRLVEDHADHQVWTFPTFERAGRFMCLARYRRVEYGVHVWGRVEIRRTSADIF